MSSAVLVLCVLTSVSPRPILVAFVSPSQLMCIPDCKHVLIVDAVLQMTSSLVMFVLAGKMDQVDARCCCYHCCDGVFAFKDLKMNIVMNQ